MEANTAIKRIIKTGKVEIGSNKAKFNLLSGKIKLIIMASNCPKDIQQDIQHYSKLSDIPVYTYKGTSLELGETIGKPFTISNLSVIDSGDINIKQLLEEVQ